VRVRARDRKQRCQTCGSHQGGWVTAAAGVFVIDCGITGMVIIILPMTQLAPVGPK
jgi:hypothetical protein